ncbi:hypothetical protein ASE39_07470 [Acidovorax sp. Root267]|uniref:hypothetical protein n=1 Tax=unclassified Acidovorax TaxID=2684926 RepID=UPI000708C50B|nr:MULTISPECIES: hypothetical protein [unclassified Acidovorax]KRD22204.1 hypothetical protein ASE39_07470 [Acidovorax sp. Root267]MBD9393042.1 hypothetical protein [Acidovorax sp. ACV01]
MTQHADQSAASPVRGFWRSALVALAVAGALGGCTSTPGSARSSDPASPQPSQGASGVTVFGDIDVGVSRERTR